MACSYYCWKGGLFGGDYWCKKTDTRVDDNTYQRYCKNYNYDECPIYKHNESGGCFITTVACEILGEQDKNPVMEELRAFRDGILQNDSKYNEVLDEYDIIGSRLATFIREDKDNYKMAEGIYKNALVPIAKLVEDGEYDKAVEKYYLMTLMLISYYKLKHFYNITKDKGFCGEDFDPKKAGHGKPNSHKLVRVKNC